MSLPAADCLYSSQQVQAALDRMAYKLTQLLLGADCPLFVTVMSGGQMMASHLLGRLSLELQTDYVQVGRYQGGLTPNQLEWRVYPQAALQGRTVVFLDDILDSGLTLKALCDYAIAQGAARVLTVVLCDKHQANRQGLTHADVTGLTVPDRFIFGFGMDCYERWRNLPAIYALKPEMK